MVPGPGSRAAWHQHIIRNSSLQEPRPRRHKQMQQLSLCRSAEPGYSPCVPAPHKMLIKWDVDKKDFPWRKPQ